MNTSVRTCDQCLTPYILKDNNPIKDLCKKCFQKKIFESRQNIVEFFKKKYH